MMYGKTARDQNGALTKHITGCFKAEVEECVRSLTLVSVL